MRMWMVDPKLMCRQHLLGEHVELHMLVGTIRKGKNIDGYVDNGLIEVQNIRSRHEELTEEMEARGYKHKSPLLEFEEFEAGEVDRKRSKLELANRCRRCFVRMLKDQHRKEQ